MRFQGLFNVLAISSNLFVSRSEDSKIVGGFIAYLRNMPFATSLQYDGQHFCGGALITLSHVLSGCHCLAHVRKGMKHDEIPLWDPQNLVAVFGIENLHSDDSEYFQRRAVKKLEVHPNCSYVKIMIYDYGVAHLERALEESVKVKPFEMFAYNQFDYEQKIKALVNNKKSNCYVAGWGSIDPDVRKASNVLKAARMRVIPDEDCRVLLGRENSKYVIHNFKESGMMCTLPFVRANESDCLGDSGGPFFCGRTVYGIVSFGFRCGQYEVPNVYAKVSCAIDWLVSLNLFPEGFQSSHNPRNGQNQLADHIFMVFIAMFTVINS